MKALKTTKIPVAVDGVNKFDNSCHHVTTASFFEFMPAYSTELIPRSKLQVKHKTFVRSHPLDKPVLGSIHVNNRAFFVPFRTVWEPFSDYITDTPYIYETGVTAIQSVPFFTMNDLGNAFTFQPFFVEEAQGSPADFVFDGTSYRFTYMGRRVYKVLRSLGYAYDASKTMSNYKFSALPLLAYVKVFIDWYWPAQYSQTAQYQSVVQIFKKQTSYQLTAGELYTILRCLQFTCYDTDDLFSQAFDNPAGPNAGAYSSSISFPDITYNSLPSDYALPSRGVVSNRGDNSLSGDNGTPNYTLASNQVFQSDLNASVITQYGLDTLKAVQSYVRRHQLTGARSLERMLAEYGVLLDADKLSRSYYLGSDAFPFEVGDVFSNAETDGASLGSYAGKGIAYSEKLFSADVDEFGMFFIVNSFIPDVSYVQGIDKNVTHLTRFDFVKGEFDGLGTVPITKPELLTQMLDEAYNLDPQGIFGFAPRYYEKKVGYDRLTGDFILNSRNADLMAWSTARLFDPSEWSNDELVHDFSFLFPTDYRQFNRVFLGGVSSDDNDDGFILVHRDDVTLRAPIKPLYEIGDFDEERDKPQITTDVNGVRFN